MDIMGAGRVGAVPMFEYLKNSPRRGNQGVRERGGPSRSTLGGEGRGSIVSVKREGFKCLSILSLSFQSSHHTRGKEGGGGGK